MMKTERRHELHSNALADWLGDRIELLRPYSRIIVGAVAGIAIVLLIYGFLSMQSSRQNEAGWKKYYNALSELQYRREPQQMTEIAQSPEMARTPVGYWAKLALGDADLMQGVEKLFTDRQAAQLSLHAALDQYALVVKEARQPMLVDRATMGMGLAYESLNELDKARDKYNILAKGHGAFAPEAEARIADLDKDSTKRFYDWFSTAKLPRAKSMMGLSGERPSFGTVPDESLFRSPEVDGDKSQQVPFGLEGSQPAGDTNLFLPGTTPTDTSGEQPAPDAGTTPDSATVPDSAAGTAPAEPPSSTP